MLQTANYLPKLKEFEGAVPYMYLDSGGNVTVGVGNLLSNAAAAQELAFVQSLQAGPSAVPATRDEIAADFSRVSSQTAGKIASFYQQFTQLELPEDVIDSLLGARVQQFTTNLCTAFPDFNSYPPEACAAIFDMAFNLGIGKLTSAFPTFCRAVRAQDWATAAAQCHRLPPVNDDRNGWTAAQLAAAHADATAAQTAPGL